MFQLSNKIYFSIFLILLAIIETTGMSLFKQTNIGYVVLGLILYITVSLGLVYLVKTRGLAVGHALYDMSTIIVATLVGLFFFKESVNTKKAIGLILAIISVILLE